MTGQLPVVHEIFNPVLLHPVVSCDHVMLMLMRAEIQK